MCGAQAKRHASRSCSGARPRGKGRPSQGMPVRDKALIYVWPATAGRAAAPGLCVVTAHIDENGSRKRLERMVCVFHAPALQSCIRFSYTPCINVPVSATLRSVWRKAHTMESMTSLSCAADMRNSVLREGATTMGGWEFTKVENSGRHRHWSGCPENRAADTRNSVLRAWAAALPQGQSAGSVMDTTMESRNCGGG